MGRKIATNLETRAFSWHKSETRLQRCTAMGSLVGTWVVLGHFQAKPELNGERGTAIHYDDVLATLSWRTLTDIIVVLASS